MRVEANENEKNQRRDQLLSQLHKITFCAFLTALTSEMCLEVEVMTSKGTCYSWIGYDDWRIYEASKNESAKLIGISEKLHDGCLSFDDIAETCLCGLAKDGGNDVDLTQLFSDFLAKHIIPGEEFYCFFDEHDEKFYFFPNKEQITCALDKSYSNVDTLWEEMDTDDLAQWWDRYESEDGEIPFCHFGDDD